jgi:hypothetical protein
MNAILETGISLVLIFFIFSTITYIIQELIAVNLKYRSKMLWKSMSQLFDGFQLTGRLKLQVALPTGQTPTTDAFYNHAQILRLHKELKKQPSYIPAANFALAIMDLVAAKAPAKQNNLFVDFQAGLKTFVNTNGNVYEVLKNLADTSSNIKELQEKIEAWFNSYMKQVTAWYESHTVVTIRLIAVALTLIFNINVIRLAKKIYNDGQLRSSLVTMAERVVDNPQAVTQYYTSSFKNISAGIDSIYQAKLASDTTTEGKKMILQEKAATLDSLAKQYTQKNSAAMLSMVNQLDSTHLPLGWKDDSLRSELKGKPFSTTWIINLLLMLIGLVIGAGCISMGAPFWFDMLNKLVNVRRGGITSGK